YTPAHDSALLLRALQPPFPLVLGTTRPTENLSSRCVDDSETFVVVMLYHADTLCECSLRTSAGEFAKVANQKLEPCAEVIQCGAERRNRVAIVYLCSQVKPRPQQLFRSDSGQQPVQPRRRSSQCPLSNRADRHSHEKGGDACKQEGNHIHS